MDSMLADLKEYLAVDLLVDLLVSLPVVWKAAMMETF